MENKDEIQQIRERWRKRRLKIRAYEDVSVSFITAIIPVLAALPTALLSSYHLVEAFKMALFVAAIVAVVFELLGFAIVVLYYKDVSLERTRESVLAIVKNKTQREIVEAMTAGSDRRPLVLAFGIYVSVVVLTNSLGGYIMGGWMNAAVSFGLSLITIAGAIVAGKSTEGNAVQDEITRIFTAVQSTESELKASRQQTAQGNSEKPNRDLPRDIRRIRKDPAAIALVKNSSIQEIVETFRVDEKTARAWKAEFQQSNKKGEIK